MKKIKCILLSLCIMSSPILANNKVSMISPQTYEDYSTTDVIEDSTYKNVDFENADDYYVWEINDYEYMYQFNTGTYWNTNCVPTTFTNLMNILGIEYNESVEEIKIMMKNSNDKNKLNEGTTIDESLRYLDNKNIEYKILYSTQSKEQIKKLIRENLIVTCVSLQYVNDEYEEKARKNGDMNSYNYTHCVLMVGYQEIDGKLQLLILDTNSSRLIVWDYDRWKIAYEKFSNMPYDSRLLIIEPQKITNDELLELVKVKTEEFKISEQLRIEKELQIQEEMENYIYPIF